MNPVPVDRVDEGGRGRGQRVIVLAAAAGADDQHLVVPHSRPARMASPKITVYAMGPNRRGFIRTRLTLIFEWPA